MLAELPSDMNGVSTTPAALHLFNVDDGAEKLDEDKAQLFHHLVAKQTRHTDRHGIAMYKGTVPRHGQL